MFDIVLFFGFLAENPHKLCGCRFDSRVKAMEVDERPTEQYSDIGGLDKQIQELIEAVVLPMTHRDKFETLGIQPPKGALPGF